MAVPPAFRPCSHLEHPDEFGVEPEAVWTLAASLDEAIRLERAIDQHTQALAVRRWLRRGGHSMADLAKVLDERPETLAAKLRGRRPAPEADLVMWSWLTGTARQHRPLAELISEPDKAVPGALLPRLGPPARRMREY